MGDDSRHSGLSRLCAGIMEAGWLTAVVLAPLFFNLYSSRIFEPDKIALLRSIAVIMACVWLVVLIEEWGTIRHRMAERLHHPVVLSAAVFTAACLIATGTSVAPDLSFFGSYQRTQGTYTLLCCVFLFFAILLEMRTGEQMDRLFMAIILGSLPLALYGIMQRFGMDPLAWHFDVAERAPSTMGNPIFTGAYLSVVSMLTWGRIAADLFETGKPRIALQDIVRTVAYGLAALVQVLALGCSDSRGPWVAWMAGAFFFILLLAVLSRRRRRIAGAVAASVLGIAVLLALNLPGGPLAPFRSVPYLGSFSRLFEGETGTGKIRTLIWEGNVRLALPHEPIRYPDGKKDALHALRPLVGYGPETMGLVFSQFYPPELSRIENRIRLIDRSHNEIWDALVSTGLLGLIGYQSLMICIFLFGLQQIGLISTGRERSAFIGSWVGLGMAGGFMAVALNKPQYCGLGFALGTAAGLLFYLLTTVFRLPRSGNASPSERGHRVLTASILAAILGHYIEVQFGIPVAGTQTLFWTAAGLLVAMGSSGLREDENRSSDGVPAGGQSPASEAEMPAERKPPPGLFRLAPFIRRTAATGSSHVMIIALILTVLFYEFTRNHERLQGPLSILWRSLTWVAPRHQGSYAALGLIAVVWVLCSLISACELSRRGRLRSVSTWAVTLAAVASTSMGLSFLYALGLASQLDGLVSSAATASVLVSEKIIGIYDFLCLALLLALLLAGLALAYGRKETRGPFVRRWAVLPLLPLIVASGCLWTGWSNLDPVRADIMIREGGIHQSHGRSDDAIAHFRRAVGLWPSDVCYSKWGGGFAAHANSAGSPSGSRLNEGTPLAEIMRLDEPAMSHMSRSDLFYAARAALMHAHGLNPLYSDHINNLARLYGKWTSLTTDPNEKSRLADQTAALYEQAVRISPRNVFLWNEWALFHLDQRGDVESALKTIGKSLAVDSKFGRTYLAAGHIHLKQKNWSRAGEFFLKALSLTPDLAEAWDKLAYVRYQQGKYSEAINANMHLLEVMQNGPAVWETHRNLAILFTLIQDPESALAHAEQALIRAPDASKPEMAAFRAEIVAQIRGAAGAAPALK